MALQSSGAISLANIQTEFGGSNPIGINEYYGSGGAPASGTISIGDFYGRSASNFTFTSNMFGDNQNQHCNSQDSHSYFGNVITDPPSRVVFIRMQYGGGNILRLYKDSSVIESWYADASLSFTTFTTTLFGAEDYYQFESTVNRNSSDKFHSNEIFLDNSGGLRIFIHSTNNYCDT